MSPVDVRIRTAEAYPSGHIVPSGVAEFKRCLAGTDATTAFYDWRSSPFARKLYLAMQDLILHQPVEARAEDNLVQYGITQGLSLAAQLLMDPSIVWPGVFGKGTPGYTPREAPEPPMTFATPASAALDEL